MKMKIWMGTVLATLLPFFYSASAYAQTVFQTGRVVQLQVIQGRSQSRQNAIQRLAGAAWQFNQDGTFVFAPANSRTDLFPLRGQFQLQGNIVSFQGSSQARNSVSLNIAEVVGQIDFSSGQPVMTLDWANGSGTGAVVNNTRFGSQNSSHYRSVLILQQVK
jgi:hypothetical protein